MDLRDRRKQNVWDVALGERKNSSLKASITLDLKYHREKKKNLGNWEEIK